MSSGNDDAEGASRPLGRRMLSIGLAVVAVGLVGATLLLFADQLRTGSGPPPQLDSQFDVEDGQVSASDCLGARDRQKAIVSLVVRRLDREALTLTLDVGLCLPPALKNRLEVRGRPVNIFDRADTRLIPRYASVPVRVEWTTGLPDRGGPHAITTARSTTLGALTKGPGDESTFGRIISPVAPLGELVLPLDAAPRRYPDDWYVLSGSLAVAIGGNEVGLPAGKAEPGIPVGPQQWLPFRVGILSEASVAGLMVEPSVSRPNKQRSRQISIELKRSLTTQAYVWIVASIPFVLACMFLVAMHGRPEHEAVRVEGLTGYTTALLAVLPIRLVLVPAGILELTLLDYWMGFEMALLVAVAITAERRGL